MMMGRCGGMFCLILAACLAGGDASNARATTPVNAQASPMYEACVAAMVKNTCSAMKDSSALSASPASGEVFVAGVGAIDAESYRQIRAYGENMCAHVRSACETASGGTQCRTAMSLWGNSAQ
jgi:hypothetical protein